MSMYALQCQQQARELMTAAALRKVSEIVGLYDAPAYGLRGVTREEYDRLRACDPSLDWEQGRELWGLRYMHSRTVRKIYCYLWEQQRARKLTARESLWYDYAGQALGDMIYITLRRRHLDHTGSAPADRPAGGEKRADNATWIVREMDALRRQRRRLMGYGYATRRAGVYNRRGELVTVYGEEQDYRKDSAAAVNDNSADDALGYATQAVIIVCDVLREQQEREPGSPADLDRPYTAREYTHSRIAREQVIPGREPPRGTPKQVTPLRVVYRRLRRYIDDDRKQPGARADYYNIYADAPAAGDNAPAAGMPLPVACDITGRAGDAAGIAADPMTPGEIAQAQQDKEQADADMRARIAELREQVCASDLQRRVYDLVAYGTCDPCSPLEIAAALGDSTPLPSVKSALRCIRERARKIISAQ